MAGQFTMARSRAATRRWVAPAVVAMAATLTVLGAAPSADAAGDRTRSATATEAAAPRERGEPIMAIVSIKGQHVTIYDADGWILRAPVSTGVAGRETPAGVFSVVEKQKDHHSSLYDDAWMPNMQRITWSGIALHGGPLPGYAASHGCIRMPYGFAENLFDKTRVGMRVIISPTDAEPVDFSDPALFVPSPEAITAAPAKAEALAAEVTEAEKAAKDAKTAASGAPRAATAAVFAQRQTEREKTAADSQLAAADRAVAAASTDEAKARAEDAKQKADAKVTELAGKLEAAKADTKAKQEAVKTLQDAVKAAEAKKAETAKAAVAAKLALEPVSIFISRATQKIYVRRDTHTRIPDGGERFDTVLELPITIRDPNKPLGTHIFTAVGRADGAGLRWTEVTIDGGDTAKDAFDRVTIPQAVLDQVASTAVPRSSIIISDEPQNSETNYRTEFVVVLNNQPQGGLAMRKRPEEDGFAPTSSREWDSPYGYGRQRSAPDFFSGFFR
jgi:hypothetical protein